MEQLILHLFGDYLTQSEWMAQNKSKRFWPAWVHAWVYATPFLLLTGFPFRSTREKAKAEAAAAGQPQTTAGTNAATRTEAQKITTSDLLNFIDGIIASQGRLLIMTTNYPDRLNPALVRSGRIDRRWEIGYAQPAQLEAFYRAAERAGLAKGISFPAYLAAMPARPTIADAQGILIASFAQRGARS